MLIVSLFIYRSYSLWTITNTQTSTNDIGVGCFSISITDQDNINLTNTFPISDAKGLTLKPYQFTIKNTCTINAKYQINLETLSTTTLDSQFVKISLDGQTPQLLNSFSSGTKNISDSISSYLLDEDYLVAGESRTYNISLWLTDTATETDAENKVLNAKITSNFVATKADYLSNRLISDAGGKSTIEAKTIKIIFLL